MSTIKQNIKRIIKFFSRHNVRLEVTPNEFEKDNIAYTHVIKITSGEVNRFNDVVEKVFLNPFKMTNKIYRVCIRADFIICRECGCSNLNACLGGCAWIEEDLCSSCYKPEKKAVTRKSKKAAEFFISITGYKK